jgi:hypothetical protein
MTRLSKLLFAVGILILIATGVGWWQQTRDRRYVTLINDEVNVGAVEKDKMHHVTVAVANSCGRPLRIVGVLNEPC